MASSTGQTVQTFSASFPTGAIFASPAGVTPTAYDGHATAQQNVWKSDRESKLSHVRQRVKNFSTTQCITIHCPVHLLKCALLQPFPVPSSPIVPTNTSTSWDYDTNHCHQHPPPSMPYWDCVSTNIPTPQYDLPGLQYDPLQPTSVTLCALLDCCMTNCHQHTHHPVALLGL